MKNRLKSMIERFGYKVEKLSYVGNEGEQHMDWLRTYPRYKPTYVTLLGKRFWIADALSFYHSYREIFVDQIYQFSSDNLVPTIIDCGASYGTSILYFKTIFPNARIIGFEPDPFIYSVLKQNVESYRLSDVELHNCAVWHKETILPFWSEKADGGRLVVQENIDHADLVEVPTVSLTDYLKGQIDLLKLDVEGAEVDILTRLPNLDTVQRIFVEYHSFEHQPQSLNDLLAYMKANGFRYQIHTQFASQHPFIEHPNQLGMDLQLNVFGYRTSDGESRGEVVF